MRHRAGVGQGKSNVTRRRASYFMNMKENEWIYVRDKGNNLAYEGRVGWHSESEHVTVPRELLQEDIVNEYEARN
jgi:hypothetical protein